MSIEALECQLSILINESGSLQERGLHPQAASLGQMLTMLDELNDCGREVEVDIVIRVIQKDNGAVCNVKKAVRSVNKATSRFS